MVSIPDPYYKKPELVAPLIRVSVPGIYLHHTGRVSFMQLRILSRCLTSFPAYTACPIFFFFSLSAKYLLFIIHSLVHQCFGKG